MNITDRRNVNPPRGSSYCLTPWEGTIHLTKNLLYTDCHYIVKEILAPLEALDSLKNLCHACFGK